MAVAAVAGDHHKFGAAFFDLVDFSAAVVFALGFIGGQHKPATATAAVLESPAWFQVHPVGNALVQDPARFMIKGVFKQVLGLATVIARIMVGCFLLDSCPVQLDPAGGNVLHQDVKDCNSLIAVMETGVPAGQPVPGGQVGVPSLGVHEPPGFQPLHVFDYGIHTGL